MTTKADLTLMEWVKKHPAAAFDPYRHSWCACNRAGESACYDRYSAIAMAEGKKELADRIGQPVPRTVAATLAADTPAHRRSAQQTAARALDKLMSIHLGIIIDICSTCHHLHVGIEHRTSNVD